MRRSLYTFPAHIDGYANLTIHRTMLIKNVRKLLANFRSFGETMSPVDNYTLYGRPQNIFGALFLHQLGQASLAGKIGSTRLSQGISKIR